MKLAGAVTEGSGRINEDGMGWCGTDGDVSAAWVFDGVTGINERNYLPGGSDAAWFVTRAAHHLARLAATDNPLPTIVGGLVDALVADWAEISSGLELPADYDPPAACLVLAKRYGGGWQAVRLGDSCLLAREGHGMPLTIIASPSNAFDHWLSAEAHKRRRNGAFDPKSLQAEFRPLLLQSRKKRNTPQGYSILEAEARAATFAQYSNLGRPGQILLCTDGFYRAADHYALHDDAGLVTAAMAKHGVETVLRALRAAEASDPDCLKFPRFKPADDATAIALGI